MNLFLPRTLWRKMDREKARTGQILETCGHLPVHLRALGVDWASWTHSREDQRCYCHRIRLAPAWKVFFQNSQCTRQSPPQCPLLLPSSFIPLTFSNASVNRILIICSHLSQKIKNPEIKSFVILALTVLLFHARLIFPPPLRWAEPQPALAGFSLETADCPSASKMPHELPETE